MSLPRHALEPFIVNGVSPEEATAFLEAAKRAP